MKLSSIAILFVLAASFVRCAMVVCPKADIPTTTPATYFVVDTVLPGEWEDERDYFDKDTIRYTAPVGYQKGDTIFY